MTLRWASYIIPSYGCPEDHNVQNLAESLTVRRRLATSPLASRISSPLPTGVLFVDKEYIAQQCSPSTKAADGA